MTHLSNYLQNHAMKQRDLAELLGISKSFMSEIVSGTKRPDLDLAFTIERATHGEVPAASFATNQDGEAASASPVPEGATNRVGIQDNLCPQTCGTSLSADR